MCVQHAAATGTKHVPGEIEQAKPRGVQEAGNHLLFVEAGALGKVQGVDSIEFMIFAVLDQPCDGIRDGSIGGLFQNRKLGLDVAHDSNLNRIAATGLAIPRSPVLAGSNWTPCALRRSSVCVTYDARFRGWVPRARCAAGAAVRSARGSASFLGSQGGGERTAGTGRRPQGGCRCASSRADGS